jgi:ABC-type phosphate transport system substrate-binding protein
LITMHNPTNSIRFLIVLLLGLALSPRPSNAGTEDLVVIANKAGTPASASRDDLRPIFQTKTSSWPDGSSVRPFNLPDGSPQRVEFDQAVLGLDADRAARYWIDRKIRGGERPPTTAPSPALMLRLVAATPGGVGYVPASAVNDTVKIVARVRGGQVVRP